MGGISSQLVEFLQQLEVLCKHRMEDRIGAIQGLQVRPGGTSLDWVSMNHGSSLVVDCHAELACAVGSSVCT